jgi:hypothetical protein
MTLYPRTADGANVLQAAYGNFNNWEGYVFLRRRPFDVDAWPLVRFRYKLARRHGGWLGARVGREALAIFDKYNHLGRELPPRFRLRGDDRWHTAVVDLRSFLREYLFRDPSGKRVVERVYTVSRRRRMDEVGPVMLLDEVMLYSDKPDTVTVTVDPPGNAEAIAGLSWQVDNDADGQAPGGPASKKLSFTVAKPADRGRFLHVRAFDGKGTPGPTTTVRLFP